MGWHPHTERTGRNKDAKGAHKLKPQLGVLDVEFLSLAIKGRFDETDIASSALNRLSTGRILDQLASMLDRSLIEAAGQGYVMTPKSRSYLWEYTIPLQERILRLLAIDHFAVSSIPVILGEDSTRVAEVLDVMASESLIMTYPIQRDGVPVRTCQITDSGQDIMRHPAEVISDIIHDMHEMDENPSTKERIIHRLERLRRSLDSASGPVSGQE